MNGFCRFQRMPAMMERFKAVLRGDAERLSVWLAASDLRSLGGYVAIILIGSGLYGLTIGIWRAPLQSPYTAIQSPLLVFLTCAGTGGLNGVLGHILGSALPLEQTSSGILMSI